MNSAATILLSADANTAHLLTRPRRPITTSRHTCAHNSDNLSQTDSATELAITHNSQVDVIQYKPAVANFRL